MLISATFLFLSSHNYSLRNIPFHLTLSNRSVLLARFNLLAFPLLS